MQGVEPEEATACQYAGGKAGEYLESIGIYDLASLSEEQWDQFCQVMCLSYVDKRLERYSSKKL